MAAYERYCPVCKEFFELTRDQMDAGDTQHLPAICGEESIPADQADVKSDYQIYSEENPR